MKYQFNKSTYQKRDDKGNASSPFHFKEKTVLTWRGSEHQKVVFLAAYS